MQKTLEKLVQELQRKSGNSCCVELESWFYKAKYPGEKDELVTRFKVWDGFNNTRFRTLKEAKEYVCKFQQK